MNLIEEAKKLGFSDAAIMDTKDLVFVPVIVCTVNRTCAVATM